jgi:hypothetical protein
LMDQANVDVRKSFFEVCVFANTIVP